MRSQSSRRSEEQTSEIQSRAATTDTYPLPLHDPLPTCRLGPARPSRGRHRARRGSSRGRGRRRCAPSPPGDRKSKRLKSSHERRPPTPTLSPYTTPFRPAASPQLDHHAEGIARGEEVAAGEDGVDALPVLQ